MTDTSTLIWGVVFGSIGFGFFLYGKKQRNIVALGCGIGLIALPYLVANVYLLILSGVVLAVLPYFLKG